MQSLSNRLQTQPDASTATALLQLQAQVDGDPSPAPSSDLDGMSLGGLKRKRCRGDFEVCALGGEVGRDVVERGLVTGEEAALYFGTFFQGCDKYVPVFDPSYDTFDSIRRRSSMLFDTIITIGCRAENGAVSSQYQALSNTTKSPIAEVLLGTTLPSIETIQALLINACYSEKGWMLTSMAVRMALDLELPDAYTQLCEIMLQGSDNVERERDLFRKARVWFGTFVLEHILSLDCGKRPGVRADGVAMRRCRVLLGSSARTTLDFRLLAQVEVCELLSSGDAGADVLLALAHDRLSPRVGVALSDRELGEIVQGTRIDLSIWLSDWITLVETAGATEEEKASLVVNLKIQRDWSEMTMLCKGLQGIGIDNVAIMSEEQRNLIRLAKISAQRHMSTIMSNTGLYLGGFRYGMDFVWAKCAFSVLLLLKLTRLLPESSNMPQLIADSKVLLAELSKVRGLNNIYFRILSLSVEKCERALKEDLAQAANPQNSGTQLNFPDAEMEFQSYVPKEFILEWSFPGLTFCWIPFDFQDLLMDFGSGL
ncbi:hypothetical protein LSUE1_G006676 [Lachnellula suecica]|uniref:Xylanolytic transcriptional activator regulatory domain-containing protein n=1 Tax=Lachnellula suecica TaxID=602035 RepID=A0A8T9C1C4_9HELO|nr:hypothetical protein LSUE1_G006676 [Lachnellula suecica]